MGEMGKPLSMSEQLIAMSKENDALVTENKELRSQVARFESPDGEGNCRFCGQPRNLPKGHNQKCYCIPTIRQYRKELAELQAIIDVRK